MTTVTDDFNRANGAVGAAWTMVPTGDGTPTFSIVSNKVQNTTTGGSFGKYARHDTATGSDDMYAQAVVSSTQTNAGSNSGVLVRGQTGSTNTSYQFTGRHAGDTLAFWKIVAGTETNLRLACNGAAGAQTLSVAWASGDTIREEVVGSLLRGKVNGALVAVTRDTSTATGQRGGLNDYNAAVGDFAEFDTFQAGPLDDLIAPYVAGVSAQVEGTSSITPTIPANVVAGDLVLVHGTILSATNTLVVPAGEGWSSAQATAGNSHGSQVLAKVWGLGGQTDDTTPTFAKSAGTEGAAATAVIIRNPLHATRPWTSVADAVLATGAQNNAASATVTAPSVSHTGDDRTVCRFFGSNDDNSLGLTTASLSNSEGALVYGGLDYDFAAGTDGAQAMSILENVDLASSTGTATVTEHVNGNDANHGITLVLGIPAVGTPATVTPGAITATATLPQPAASTMAGPAVLAAAATLPRPAGNVQASPTALAATVAVPTPITIGVTLTQPAALAATTALPQAAVSTGSTIAPAAIQAVTSLPAPVAATGTTAAPAAVQAVPSLPQPAANTSAGPAALLGSTAMTRPAANVDAGPAAIPATATFPHAAVAAVTLVQPNPLATAAVLPQAVPSGVAVVSPSTVAAPVSLPTPVLAAGSAVQPAVLAAIASLPTPSLSGTATGTPPAIAVASSLPTPSLDAYTVTQPPSLAVTASMPPATPTGAATAQPGPVTAATLLVLPSISVSAGPSATTVVVSLPGATVAAGGNVTVTADVIDITFTMPGVDVGVSAGPLPVILSAALPSPTLSVATTAAPSAVAALVDLPSPTVLAGGNVTVTPVSVLAAVTVPAGTVSVGAGADLLAVTTALPSPAVSAGGAGATVTPLPIPAAVALPAAATFAGAFVSPVALVVVVTFGAFGPLGRLRFATRSAPRLQAVGRTDPLIVATAAVAAHVHIDTATAEEVTFT